MAAEGYCVAVRGGERCVAGEGCVAGESCVIEDGRVAEDRGEALGGGRAGWRRVAGCSGPCRVFGPLPGVRAAAGRTGDCRALGPPPAGRYVRRCYCWAPSGLPSPGTASRSRQVSLEVQTRRPCSSVIAMS